MPRPARFAAKEKALAGGAGADTDPPAAKAVEKAAGASSDTGVDAGQGSRQPSARSGKISLDAVDPQALETVARSTGWVPREEWKLDASKWTDASTYLEGLPTRMRDLKNRVRTVAAVADQANAEDRRRTREEAEAAVRAAAVAKDPDAAVEASKKLATVSGPPPQTLAWIAKNPWWNDDPIAQAAAVAEIRRRNKEFPNEGIQDQLDAAEAIVRKRFPEHFDPPARREEPEEQTDDRRDVRLSEVVRREPPAMAEGQRGGSGGNPGGRRREMGWGDVPALDRDALQPFVKKMKHRGLDEAEAQKRLAASYWDNKAKRAAAAGG